jgi:hypothetical protein
MPTARSVDEIMTAIKDLGEEDRGQLLIRLAQIDELMEDLEDVAELIRAARTSSRPFDEFMAELKAERGDV